MSTNAITENKPDPLTGAPPVSQPGGPSLVREDEPTVARGIGMAGAALVIFGGMALGFNLWRGPGAVSVGVSWATLFLAVGLAGLLMHAAYDRDVQFRRLYMIFAFALVGLGALLWVLPYPARIGDQFRWAVPCLMVGFAFLLAFLRVEDEPGARNVVQMVLLGGGAFMAFLGFFGGHIRGDFFLPVGFVSTLLGLLYVAGFVGTRGVSDNLAYYAALGLGGVGLLNVGLTVVRSLPFLSGPTWFVAEGLILLLVGSLYVLVSASLALEWPVLVLMRRELGAFFYSPMAYLVLFGFAFISWFGYLEFLARISLPGPDGRPAVNFEPIVHLMFVSILPVFTLVFIVPVLTMRLLSEEHRTGTLEVMLTAPVDETVIVLGKFLAGMVMYAFVWSPFAVYLMAVPLMGGSAFDHRPLLSFLVAWAVTGAGFMAMGLFFSSLTANQVASGVLTLVGMLGLTLTYWLADRAEPDSLQRNIFDHMNYIMIWSSSLQGRIVPRELLFYASLTVLSLFLTTKVLESRKWR